jgi:hypothetical protein
MWSDPAVDLNELFAEKLDELGGGYLSRAMCVSNSGLVAGCYVDANETERVCLCDPASGELWVCDSGLPFSIRDLNDNGTVVGYLANDAGQKQGFIWSPFREDGFLLLPEAFALTGINNFDVVVGIYEGDREEEIFCWQLDWAATDLTSDIEWLAADPPPLLGFGTNRPAINNEGTITSYASLPDQKGPAGKGALRRLLPNTTVWEYLASDGWVTDINDQGQVVGTNSACGFVYDAAQGQLWQLQGEIIDDVTGQWPDDWARPTGVADQSVLLSHGSFSTIVGYSIIECVEGPDAKSFVLIPKSPPSRQ